LSRFICQFLRGLGLKCNTTLVVSTPGGGVYIYMYIGVYTYMGMYACTPSLMVPIYVYG